jgi:hypothetical protein
MESAWELVIKVHVHTTINIVVTTSKKVDILNYQNAMHLFMVS